MAVYNLKDVARIVKGQVHGCDHNVFRFISIDSRTITSPEESLFFAIRGNRHDGHAFIVELIEKKVRNFIVNKIPDNIELQKDIGFIVVDNTLEALHRLSAFHRARHTVPVIGITGSNGKTVIKEWIFQVLHTDKKIVRSPKSYNSQVGVPISVWLMDDTHELGIFEAGISQPGEMKKLQPVIDPVIGVFTNIGEAHQENFTSMEEKVLEKTLLFRNSKVVIYCSDHVLVDRIIRRELQNARLFSWSAKNQSDLRIHAIQIKENNTDVTLEYQKDRFIVSLPFTDNASLENAIHVTALLLYLGYDKRLIISRLSKLTPVAMRLELVKGINGCTLINDTYNSDLNSLAIAIDFLKQQNQHSVGTLILSDILQSGKSDEFLYKEVAELINDKRINRFIGIGEALSAQKALFPPSAKFYNSTDEFLYSVSKDDFKGEAILLKGSRKFQFEKITAFLQEKVHKTILEIDLNSLIHNLNVYRSLLKPDTRIMVMVKAFSYGTGTYEIANALQFQRVDYLCVAFVDEGITLRKSGINLPILVMNPEVASFNLLIDYNLEPEIYNARILKEFENILCRKNLISYPIHLKIDTGMHRLGFSEDELDNILDILKDHDQIRVQSVFSHLAASDDPEQDEFTKSQIRQFRQMSGKIQDVLEYRILKHILNTSGIERYPEAQFDMVRLGIGLYGVSPTLATRLQNVSTLKSTISQIKKVKHGDSIGYGRAYIADKDLLIGIVPIGYADGLNRSLGNGKGKLLIRDKAVPIIGNICMDMCMVDITGLEIDEGEEVIVFGDRFSVSDLAKQLNTIPYEILAGISSRVKRIYYQE